MFPGFATPTCTLPVQRVRRLFVREADVESEDVDTVTDKSHCDLCYCFGSGMLISSR